MPRRATRAARPLPQTARATAAPPRAALNPRDSTRPRARRAGANAPRVQRIRQKAARPFVPGGSPRARPARC